MTLKDGSEIEIRDLRPQARADRILRRLGLHEESRIPEQTCDQDGEGQELIILRCILDQLWREMESLVEASDRRWHR